MTATRCWKYTSLNVVPLVWYKINIWVCLRCWSLVANIGCIKLRLCKDVCSIVRTSRIAVWPSSAARTGGAPCMCWATQIVYCMWVTHSSQQNSCRNPFQFFRKPFKLFSIAVGQHLFRKSFQACWRQLRVSKQGSFNIYGNVGRKMWSVTQTILHDLRPAKALNSPGWHFKHVVGPVRIIFRAQKIAEGHGIIIRGTYSTAVQPCWTCNARWSSCVHETPAHQFSTTAGWLLDLPVHSPPVSSLWFSNQTCDECISHMTLTASTL